MSSREEGAKQPERVPIIEESLEVGKRQVETGRVRVRTSVETHQELAEAELERSDVQVERVRIGRVVDSAPRVREEGDKLIIPVTEERLVITKELVLVEELHLRRQVTVEQFEQPVDLRRTRAVVEREES